MATPAALRVMEHHLVVYKATWRGTVVSSFGAPVLFLAAMGIGLGSLVDQGPRAGAFTGGSYLEFVGPGLLAASAMQVAAMESMFPVMAGIKWLRTYHAMLATPIGVGDLVVGQFAWIAGRVVLGATAYLLVLTLFGVASSALAILALPAAVLCGMAFSTPIAAFAATQENDQGFILLFRLGVMPLFLFSGTFFPVDQLPRALEVVAWFTPLWHGVQLCRGLVLGDPGGFAEVVVHVGYLVAWTVAGYLVAHRTFAARLAP